MDFSLSRQEGATWLMWLRKQASLRPWPGTTLLQKCFISSMHGGVPEGGMACAAASAVHASSSAETKVAVLA